MYQEAKDSYSHKFDSPFTAWLWDQSMTGAEEETGSVEAPTGWVGRMGRNLLHEDSQGFVSRERYPSVEAAIARFDILDAEWAAWDDDDE